MNSPILLSPACEKAGPISPIIFSRFKISAFQLLLLFSLSTFDAASAQTNVTPAQYLASQPKPNFAPGHHLPVLARWGWTLSSNAGVELANNWGYALELDHSATAYLVSKITTPGTFDYGMIQLARNNPDKYKLSVITDTTFPAPTPNEFYCTNINGWFLDSYGNRLQYASNGYTGFLYTNSGIVWVYDATNLPVNMGWRCVCPEGPDSYWQAATEFWMQPLRAVQSNAPIAIILDGGEYGLDQPGWGETAWKQDPRVQVQAVMTNAWSTSNTNGISWPRYSSNQKAHQLGFLTAAIQQSIPQRQLHIYYNTCNEQTRIYQSPGYTNWNNLQDNWGWNSDVMNTNTDLPSFELYYSPNHGWTNIPGANWSQITDLLTGELDAVGYDIKLGYSLNYSWLNGGSGTNAAVFSDIPHYMGFLKCLYTSGTVGGIAAYFNYPAGGFDATFPSNSPPQWLLQIMALAQVHALFSQFDSFLYNGDLLSGPQHNSLSADQPAYEFTNTAADATARVLVRKLRSGNQWLVTAWAAAGPDRTVTAIIPILGSVSVLARACGSVYQATTTNLTLIDTNGMLPSSSFEAGPAPPTDLHIIPGSTN